MTNASASQAWDFWAHPSDIHGLAEARRNAFDNDEFGLQLFGPSEVPLERRSTLPLLGIRVARTFGGNVLNFEHQALLVVSRLEGGEFFVGKAFYAKVPPRPVSRPEPGDRPVDAVVARTFAIAPRLRIRDLPWKPGTVVSTLITFDERSNSVRTHLQAAAPHDPAVREFLERQRRPAYPGRVWPPGLARADTTAVGSAGAVHAPDKGGTRRGESEEAPEIPDAEGIVLRADRVLLRAQDSRWRLSGSFRVVVPRRYFVRPLEEVDQGETEIPVADDGRVDVGDPNATAVIPLSILVTGQEFPDPHVWRLQVPCYETVDLGRGEQLITGSFALDLEDLGRVPNHPQAYALWAFFQDYVGGPTITGLMSESMLPERGV
jgi:hypothetical protein